MRKLAKCVDVSVSSLYYHYESKEALFHDMLDQACKKVVYPIEKAFFTASLRSIGIYSHYSQEFDFGIHQLTVSAEAGN